jgi:hypothetical protein
VGHRASDSRARLGPVKVLASLDRLRGLSALTGLSDESSASNCDGPATLHDTMEEITSSDATDLESIARARELLDDEGVGLSDEEIEIRRHADVMAHALIEAFLVKRPTVH